METPHGRIEEWSRKELITYVRDLQALLEDVRTCADGRCHLCAQCVTRIFVGAKPTPHSAIPARYREVPWRKG